MRTLFLNKKYNNNIDDIYLKDKNQEPKKWSLFGIVGIYYFETYLTLKGRLVPEETAAYYLKFTKQERAENAPITRSLTQNKIKELGFSENKT